MANRRPAKRALQNQLKRKSQTKSLRRELGQRMRVELLEDRRMMAGPQLVGILPDDGHLLASNETLNVAPLDLTFRFNEGQVLDFTTVSGVQIWRAGLDGAFSPAAAATDFNTNGAVEVTFAAKALGTSQNGIQVQFTRTDQGGLGAPKITVNGTVVTIDLNTNSRGPSTAQDVVTALNADAVASTLISAKVTGGLSTTNVAAPAITYSPLTLTGANAASGLSDLNTNNAVRLKFTSVVAGAAGNGRQVVFTKSALGAGVAPVVTVSGTTVTVQLNNTVGSKSRASDVVTAINTNTAASALVRAAVVSGNASTDVATPVVNNTAVTLDGANDVLLSPGYIGRGESDREIIARFKDRLPDDRYHIDILGSTAQALRNDQGEAFNGGLNFQREFELDLGAQVVAVVPQPIDRAANGTLSQRRNQIDVYFNNDDLYPTALSTGQISPNPAVVDPAFYRLIFTRDTVENTDDVTFTPASVQYDPVSDKAVLTFAANIDQLPTGAGTYRLRVGTNETLPAAPQLMAPAATVSSDMNTGGLVSVRFDAVTPGEAGGGVAVSFARANLGLNVQPQVTVYGSRITVVLNNSSGSKSTAQQVVDAINNSTTARAIVRASIASGTASTDVTTPNASPLVLSLVWNGGQGSSFETAANIGTLTAQNIVVSSAIDPQVYTLQFPGDTGEPGHREINLSNEMHLPAGVGDTTAGITTVRYNFRSLYGYDPSGNPLFNLVTENQKQRAREIFEQISRVSGIQFLETASDGLAIVTGDMRAIAPLIQTGAGYPYSLSGSTAIGPAVILDNAESWDDAYGSTWFQRTYHEIGAMLGLGNTFDLPPGTIMGQDGPAPTTNPLDNVNSSQGFSTPGLEFDNRVEPVFPGDADIVHLQNQYRPESKDIDMYRFTLDKRGRFTVETTAERRFDSSLLNTALRLWQQVDVKDANGTVIGTKRELVAQNDDYFSKDSFIGLDLQPGTYWVGVSASGNTSYDPTIEDTGLGGTTQGGYDLRFNFRPAAAQTIVDSTGVALDGDGDGTPGGVYNFWFRAQSTANTIFVDKSATSGGAGTLASPRNNLAQALGVATPGQIVRVLGNNGADANSRTLTDNLPYEVGFNSLGSALPDGSTLDVPKGVTVMVDAGAIFKMRRSAVNVGSTSPTIDRSAGSLQVLGTPVQSVYFTSYDDATIGRDNNPDTVLPAAGNWGGLAFRNDVDGSDATRFNYEDRGIFLNYVNHADLRYGGGNVTVASVSQIVTPINLVDSRPTVSFNQITFSADAALSATPNSFEEDNFHAPQYQLLGREFTSDYDRVGPDIHGNALVDANGNGNSVNGLAVRVKTPAGNTLRKLTVSARMDDRDIVHVISENLVIDGTPGGPLDEIAKPSVSLVTTTRLVGGGQASFGPGNFRYRVTFVDGSGNEGLASDPTSTVTIAAGDRVRLNNLPAAPSGFVSRRIYRSDSTGAGTYSLIAQINATDTTYTDTGVTLAGILDERLRGFRPRLDARLAIDPAMVVKLSGAGISTNMGGQLIAEGQAGLETVFTSIADDRFGGGGTFLTKNDGASHTDYDTTDTNAPHRGDWSGLFVGPYSSASLDHVVIAGAGGVTRVEGSFTAFNAVEVHQSEARIADSVFEYNQNGLGGQAPSGRFGRGFNEAASIFVRGSQPVILDNVLRHNAGPAVSINVNSLNATNVVDFGRTTGMIDASPGFLDNQGPLVAGNRLDDNAINGMVVRGETTTTEVVWDDTDIVHVLLDTVYVYDFHTYGGVRLESSTTHSLVVKLFDQDATGADPNVPDRAAFVANGRPLEIDDRIGGILQVIGMPGFPVVLTSITDDTVGAGFKPDGTAQTDTDNRDPNGQGGRQTFPTGPEVNNGLLIDNDVLTTNIGHFEIQPGVGGQVTFGGGSGVTVQGATQLFVNQNFIFLYQNYIDVGSNGGAVTLASTTITQQPTLVSPDRVVSRGTFAGANGTVAWQVDTFLNNGEATVYNQVTFDGGTNPLGDIRFINYLDEDVFGVSDDMLLPTGTPGQPDFRAFTLDNAERIGFAHGGFYQAGTELQNASYTGWAADQFNDLQTAITSAAGAQFSIPGVIDTTDLPPFNDPQLGAAYGLEDVTTAFAWNVEPTSPRSVVTSFLELVPRNPGNASSSGEWQGLTIGEYAADRNVETVIEAEPAGMAPPGRNGSAQTAQYLGSLGAYEKAGDENLRLGFTVNGAVGATSDVDVYSFTAKPGTRVWLDIDRTTQALDTVLELVDDDGVILAQSDNSAAEGDGLSNVYEADGVNASPLTDNGPFAVPDRWTMNPRDAGMSVVLPGQGDVNTYHVRIRSSNLKSGDPSSKLLDPAQVGGGLTAGVYQLQIRLRELDEIGGTTVRYADIRYAQNGITVQGQPTHSPLLGEASEREAVSGANDTFNNAQGLGNLLTSDRGVASVAGDLGLGTDVDWYRLDVTYSELEAATTAMIGAAFDIDYADGMARPDTMMSVFDANGRLIYTSTDSNIGDDRPQPLGGSSVSDLARGSVGALDPYIGSVNLVTGTYFVAISSKARMPQQLEQFLVRTPSNPLLRLEPNDSLVRVVESHLEAAPQTTFQPALTQNFINGQSAIPFSLGDVKLFISYDNNTFYDRSTLATVNPFTGRLQSIVNNNDDTLGFYPYDAGDIAMRDDGRLYTFSMDVEDGPIDPNGPTDAESGNFVNIDTGTGAGTLINDDAIATFIENPPGSGTVADAGFSAGKLGVGMQFEAVTFTPTNLYGSERLIAVGYRPDEGIANGVKFKRNVLYQFTNNVSSGTQVGVATPNPGKDRFQGAGTDAQERGRIITGGEIIAAEATFQNANTAAQYPNITVFNLQDANSFTINDGFEDHTFEFDAGPEVLQNINETATNPNPGRTIRDGNFFVLDPNADPLVTNDETIFQFDTGPVIVVNNSTGLVPFTLSVNGLGGVTETFEFVDAGFNNGKPLNPNNTAIDVTGNLTAVAVAGLIAGAINGGTSGATAAAVGTRVTLTNENTVATSAPGQLQISGDRGRASILEAVPGANLIDGQVFRLQFAGIGTYSFEFDSNGFVTGGNIRVPFTPAMTVQQVATSMQSAIATSNAPVAPTPQLVAPVGGAYGRVVVNGRQMTYLQATSVITDMTQRLLPRVYQINVEENWTAAQVGAAVEATVNTASQFTASSDIGRINFPPPKVTPGFWPVGTASTLQNRIAAEAGDFNGVPQWVDRGSTYGVAPGHIAIPFWATDSDIEIARQMTAAINATNIPGVTATQNGASVTIDGLLHGTITTSPPLTGLGNGPGGIVTGMAGVPGGLFVVTDTGGLYRINPDLDSVIVEPPYERIVPTTYIANSADDLLGIQFAGLAAGPANVENGRYANLLFGIDRDGRMYAFNTQGVLQPIFVDGQTSVDTGIQNLPGFDGGNLGGIQGLAFSTLDSNLWHITPTQPVQASATPMDVRVGAATNVGDLITVDSRQFQIGHGLNATYDTIRDPVATSQLDPNAPCSLIVPPFPYCGQSSFNFGQGIVGNTPRTYDFPGGADGTVITNEFSLEGYTAADQPVLYFTYYSGVGTANAGYDTFRTFVQDSSGAWVRVVQNQGGAVFDNTNSWRQARIDLSAFAGQANLKLRFDFSTAGDMNLGDTMTTGSELWARAGSELRDGQTFQIDNEIFEIDLGYTLVPPSGAAIIDGETFTVTDVNNQSVTYEFDGDGILNNAANVRILLDPKQTAADMARLISLAVTLNGPSNVVPHVVDNRVNLEGARSLIQGLAPGETQLGVVLEGQYGVTPTYNAVTISQDMTATQVATAIDAALEPIFHSQAMIAQTGLRYADGDAFQLNDGTQTVNFEFDSGYILSVPATGGQAINDGDTITIYGSTLASAVTLEFNKTGGVALGNIAVNITNVSSALTVATAIRQAILGAAAGNPDIAQLGIANPSVLSGSRVQLGGVVGTVVRSRTAAIGVTGQPGVSGAVQFQVPGALGIRVPASGGPVLRDGETFTVSDGTNSVVFELDSNATVTAGRVGVTFAQTLPGGAPLIIANQISAAIAGEVAANRLVGLAPVVRGNGANDVYVDLGSDSRHTVNTTNTSLISLGRSGAVQDGEQFTLGDGTRSFTFEMNRTDVAVVTPVLPGNLTINYDSTQDPDVIATNIANAIAAAGLTGFTPTTQALGVVTLGENTTSQVNSAGLSGIVRTGAPGDNVFAVTFSPSSTFDSARIAQALTVAINASPLNVTASVQAAAQRRVTLTGNEVVLQQNGVAVAQTVTPPLSFEAPTNIVKGYRDMINVIGHTVNDPGPLGLADSLPGDFASDPFFQPLRRGYNGNLQGQDNRFEGFYLDDFIIGFAERGEMVTGADRTATNANSTAFVPNPALQPTDIVVGPYQLEVRRSEEYSVASVPTAPFRSFDTNDRLATGLRLIAQDGARLLDGQTFTLSDGQNSVTFEYDDKSILPTNPRYGIEPGRVAVDFNPTEPDYVVAARIRDLINGPAVQAVLVGVSSALADGTDGVVRTGPSTDNKIDIFGRVALLGVGSPVPESNDTIATATETGIVGLNSPNYRATGEVGDNPNFLLQRGKDVDLFHVYLNAGETLTIDVDANEVGSTLDPTVAVFNAAGSALAFNATGRGAGELVSRDAFLQFTPAIAGDYYIGVSGANGTPVAAPFTVYNPTIEGSNNTGSTGFYELNLTFGDPARASSQTFTDSGDQNRVREQGQILLQGNRISAAAQFGIVSTAAGTDPLSGEAHQGPVRQLRELNFANLAPGVVIANNLLVGNLQGGIHFSGDSVTANAPTPFGRIINNTVWGNGGTLASGAGRGDIGILVDDNSSPTLLNNVLVNLTTGIQVSANSSTTVVGGSVYQGNRGNTNGVSVEDFPIVLPDTAQVFVNPLLGNFYPAKGSPIIDSSIDSLLERASLETVKAPLGIAPSPILAPERDLYGLLRVDDPNSSSPIGFGENVFKDRGAIDRADFSGSVAQLINPRDEVFTGAPPLTTAATDRNGAAAFVQLSNTPLYDFSIQLIDGVEPADPVNGIGVDDTTVTKEKVFVQRDTQLLQEGTDYKFVYDGTNNIIRIVPLAGVWDLDRVYTLDLVNRDQFAFTAPSGNQVTEGQTFTVGDGVTTRTFEFDSGYVLQVPAAGVADGQRFTIVNGLNPPVTFEFDRNGVSTAGNVRISFTSSSTQNDIANLIVGAIRGVTGLGLSPVNVANGQVWIGGTTNHSIDVRQSNLQVTGQPGAQTVGAIPVPFIPGFVPTTTAGATPTTPAMPADLLANSITTTIQNSGLSGVRATWRSYTVGTTQTVEVDVRGAATVTGFTTTFTPAIRDLAGNDLKANLATGETTFTIFLGNGLDFGDAPTPYPTATSGAASHGIVNGFFLGGLVDAEPNGQPTIGADGDDGNGLPDDEDGITFNSPVAQAGTVTITVTAASPGGTNGQPAGFLDAFIDFNRDGDWDDPSDRIFASRQLVVGANTLTFNVPSNASIGSTYARFRYSSTGGLTSSGAAGDGEVEDYQVTIGGPPWQNATNRFDVNNDGHVTPIDVLQIVNFLNSYPGVSALPNPPPFVPISGTPIYPDNTGVGRDFFIDVSGDGFVSPIDALLIVNLINSGGGGEGGEPEGEADDSSSDVATNSPALWAPANVSSAIAPREGARDNARGRSVEFTFNVADRGGAQVIDAATLADDSIADLLNGLDDVLDRVAADNTGPTNDDHDSLFALWS